MRSFQIWTIIKHFKNLFTKAIILVPNIRTPRELKISSYVDIHVCLRHVPLYSCIWLMEWKLVNYYCFWCWILNSGLRVFEINYLTSFPWFLCIYYTWIVGLNTHWGAWEWRTILWNTLNFYPCKNFFSFEHSIKCTI